jgi:hypothetical protein
MAIIETRIPNPDTDPIVTRYVVRCDTCRRELPRRFLSMSRAVLTAFDLGWRISRTEATCPRCVQKTSPNRL